MGMKFGCKEVKEENNMIKVEKYIGIKVVGVSFNVGYGCGEKKYFNREIV